MTLEQHHLAVELFEQLCDCGSNQQGEFLKQACAGDDELHRTVEAMLAADQNHSQFLETPPNDLVAEMMADREWRPVSGQRFGDYVVLERLGTGGMSEVFLAQDTQLERKAALKFLSQDYNAESANLQRFEREARAVSALNHPNIVTVYGFGQVAGVHFIATEFIDGRNLRDELSKGPLAPEAVIDIAIQAASALAAAHEAGIIHRDVKPENIMLRADGLVKIVDFGLAKRTLLGTGSQAFVDRLKSPTVPGLILGTPRYMSPEQARGLPVDARTDLFSFGLMLYEALTATPAVSGTNLGDILSVLLSHEPPPLETVRPDCPAGLVQIVRKALEKDRNERYQSVEEMLADLKSVRQDIRTGKVSPVRVPPGSAERRTSKRWRTWLIGAAIAVVSCIGLLTITHRVPLQLLLTRESVLGPHNRLDPASYESYLRARHFLARRNAESMKKALAYFQEVLDRNPEYAPAYSGLALAYGVMGTYEVLPPEKSFPNAKSFASRALQLEDSLAEAYTARAIVASFWEWSWSAADQDFRRAIALEPSSALAHHFYAEHWINIGRADRAVVEMQRARDLDPLSLVENAALGRVYRDAHRYAEGLGQCRKTLDLDPNIAMGHWCLGQVYIGEHHYATAIRELELANTLGTTPLILRDLAWAYAAIGQKGKASAILDGLTRDAKSEYVSPYTIGAVHAALGEKDEAFAYLEGAFAERDCHVTYLALDPQVDPIRSDPRFQRLLGRLHIPR